MKHVITRITCMDEYFDVYPDYAIIPKHVLTDIDTQMRVAQKVKHEHGIEATVYGNYVQTIHVSDLEDIISPEELTRVECGEQILIDIKPTEEMERIHCEARVTDNLISWSFNPKHTNIKCEIIGLFKSDVTKFNQM
jgi:hypothetical protein